MGLQFWCRRGSAGLAELGWPARRQGIDRKYFLDNCPHI